MDKKYMSRRTALKIMGSLCATTAAVSCNPLGSSSTVKDASLSTEKTKRLIFFFSATGNSLYISKEIGGEEGKLLSISQEVHNENPVYEAEEIGFVFPLYCFLPPAIVQDFIERSTFKADYLFAVGTFGQNHADFVETFDKYTQEHGIHMNYISSIRMVDTYLPWYDIEEQLKIDKHIPEQLEEVMKGINSRQNFLQEVTDEDRQITAGYFAWSGRERPKPTFTRAEKVVYSTDACIGCGICSSVCPHGSWKVIDGKAVSNGDCENCLACVHNCPRKAISIIRRMPEPEEPNRNARYRNANVKLIELIKANSQID